MPEKDKDIERLESRCDAMETVISVLVNALMATRSDRIDLLREQFRVHADHAQQERRHPSEIEYLSRWAEQMLHEKIAREAT